MPLPVVLVDHPAESWKKHSIALGNEAAAYDATRRILAQGHKHIAFVRRVLSSISEIDPDSVERQKGFLRAMKEAGVKKSKARVVNVTEHDRQESAALRTLFRGAPKVSAVLVADERIASIIADSAKRKGNTIPGKFSIVCFQGLRTGDQKFTGPITNFEELGCKAAALLTAPAPAQRILLTPDWVDAGTLSPHAKFT